MNRSFMLEVCKEPSRTMTPLLLIILSRALGSLCVICVNHPPQQAPFYPTEARQGVGFWAGSEILHRIQSQMYRPQSIFWTLPSGRLV